MKNATAFAKMKEQGTKIAALTAYDSSFAALVQEAGCDTALVGDSLGMVVHGKSSTHSVTVDDIAYHVRCVTQGAQQLHVMADLPFGSYENSPEQAFSSAVRLLAAGAQMVKLEGGSEYAETISYLVERGVPVCAHVGLLPQSALTSGMKIQGKGVDEAERILKDASDVSSAGAALIVLEAIPASLAKKITDTVTSSTIGIGAGRDCDGQILVLHDVLGVFSKPPSFAKDFLEGSGSVLGALRGYVKAVRDGEFPGAEHTKA